MQKINQRGFAGIEIVLGVLLVAAIGAAGYFAYQARHQEKVNSAVVSTPKQVGGEPSASRTKNTVAVKELGVQMTFEDNDKVGYTMDSVDEATDLNGDAYGPILTATFEVNGCEVAKVSKTSVDLRGRVFPVVGNTTKKIKDFYLTYETPGATPENGCTDGYSGFLKAYETAQAL